MAKDSSRSDFGLLIRRRDYNQGSLGRSVVLFAGEPLAGPRHVWWNFVSSSRERIEQAKSDWKSGRFAPVQVILSLSRSLSDRWKTEAVRIGKPLKEIRCLRKKLFR
jgi:hypothetical protein